MATASSHADESHPDEAEKRLLGHYELGKVIGAGAFSKVRIAVHTVTNEKVAVKIVNKDQIHNIKDLERVMREMHVLKNIIHPNIIRMHEVVEKGSRLYLVLDFANGGELYNYIMGKGAIPEREARVFFGQILSGVDFFHRQNISHRDLKPENVLLVEQAQGTFVCKVADFGLSNDMRPGELLKTTCGTPAYAAPEMTLGQRCAPHPAPHPARRTSTQLPHSAPTRSSAADSPRPCARAVCARAFARARVCVRRHARPRDRDRGRR